jgi:hypothetical protein
MMYSDLTKLTGKLVKEWYHWLSSEKDGCCSLCFDSTEKYNYVVCMGWHHYDDEMVLDKNGNPVQGEHGIKYRPVWKIAWKIGRQTRNNIMQCDFDVDFEMPYNDETGDVDDTLEVIECAVLTNCRRGLPYSAPSGYRGWDALASYMRRQARRVFRDWKDRDE